MHELAMLLEGIDCVAARCYVQAMGASGWSYFVSYEADVESALTKLKAKVRKSGKYYKGGSEEGTHSILHISKTGAEPAFGVVAPLPEAELVTMFGTAQPTRAIVEAHAHELGTLRRRWMGTYVVVYEAGTAQEILFAGFSGD